MAAFACDRLPTTGSKANLESDWSAKLNSYTAQTVYFSSSRVGSGDETKVGLASLVLGTCQDEGGARLPQYEPDGAKILAFCRSI